VEIALDLDDLGAPEGDPERLRLARLAQIHRGVEAAHGVEVVEDAVAVEDLHRRKGGRNTG
jgi:hypothetical protein